MKRTIILLLTILLLAIGTACSPAAPKAQIAATTLPVYDFTSRLCTGTDLAVTRIITQEISCLHDYTLQVNQVKAIENAQILILSGAGLEEGLLPDGIQKPTVDASKGIALLCNHIGQDQNHGHDHTHTEDPHIWLSPENAKVMAVNICEGLTANYPQHTDVFLNNLEKLTEDLEALIRQAESELKDLKCRKLVTFHDGFFYMAQAWNLELLHAVEEESGSEASAKELITLTKLIKEHQLPAIFTEKSGSISASQVVARETGISSYALDMAMAGNSYFDAMYHNIHTLKEALG